MAEATAPAGSVHVFFFLAASGSGDDYAAWDCLYACRKVSAGMLEADILKALLIKGEVIETPNYVPGSAGVAPVGVKLSGVPFAATLKDGSTLQVNMELGTSASIGGERVQTILDAQTAANNAATAAAAAQAAANAAASAAAYADRLARSSYNLIKNGNSEDANPTGLEAAWISDSGAYAGTRCRAKTVTAAGGWPETTVGEAPCDPGDQFVFSAWGKQATASSKQHIFIEFLDAADARVGISIKAFQASTAYTKVEVSGEAPAGAVMVRFVIYVDRADVTTYYWDCLYACRKISAGMLETDAIRSTTSNFSVTSTTASSSTTTGAVVVAGGVASGDFFTGKYRSSDGSVGLTATRTFYAASSSGGATNVLNTVTIKDGIITSWTQA